MGDSTDSEPTKDKNSGFTTWVSSFDTSSASTTSFTTANNTVTWVPVDAGSAWAMEQYKPRVVKKVQSHFENRNFGQRGDDMIAYARMRENLKRFGAKVIGASSYDLVVVMKETDAPNIVPLLAGCGFYATKSHLIG